jgi:hypothetical protein
LTAHRAGHRLERAGALGPVDEIERVGQATRPVGSKLRHHHQAIGLGIRQRPQQRGIGDGEHRAVGADAEREREYGDQRECR